MAFNYYSNPSRLRHDNSYDQRFLKEDPTVVMIKNDELGEERFKSIENALKTFKIGKEHARRLDNLQTVFYYRLEIAKQAKFPMAYPGAERRLRDFLTVDQLLAAAKSILTEVQEIAKEEALKKTKLVIRRPAW